MRIRLLKELRALAPIAGIAALLNAVCFLKANDKWLGLLGAVVFITRCTIFPLMAVIVFGSEVEQTTLASLLVQPVARRRVWHEKTLALAGVTAILLLLHVGCVLVASHLRLGPLPESPLGKLHEFSLHAETLGALLSFGGGLLMSLTLRNQLAAALATLAAPCLVWGLLYQVYIKLGDWVGSYQLPRTHDPVVLLVVLWAAITYALAYRRWIRLEVRQ
jgi:hypothetical protein